MTDKTQLNLLGRKTMQYFHLNLHGNYFGQRGKTLRLDILQTLKRHIYRPRAFDRLLQGGLIIWSQLLILNKWPHFLVFTFLIVYKQCSHLCQLMFFSNIPLVSFLGITMFICLIFTFQRSK